MLKILPLIRGINVASFSIKHGNLEEILEKTWRPPQMFGDHWHGPAVGSLGCLSFQGHKSLLPKLENIKALRSKY